MIRKASLKDLKQIAELYHSEMSIQFRDVGEEPITAKEFERRLKKHFEKSKMFILDIEGIKGFIWYFKEGKEYNLEEIFVTEKGKGYGKLLMDFVLEEARKKKIQKLNLDVHFKNKTAQDFFKKFGFSERTIEMSLDL
ncbi:MAG: N-acetyltransferase family protein [Minisyncoccales bacterium]